MSVRGVLRDHRVWVEDPAAASRLNAKAGIGTLRSGNMLELHPIEAADAMRQGRLDVEGMDWADLAGDDVGYLCYADLKERGLIVQVQEDHLVAWERGQRAPQEPWFRCWVHAEREPVTPQWLQDRAGDVLAIVDEDGVVTYYESEAVKVQGQNPVGDWRGEGRLLGDRVLVQGHGPEGLGTRHGDTTLLSLVEAAWLADHGRLNVDADLHVEGSARHGDFEEILQAYTAMRSAGVLAKSGYRFGTHLRGYRNGIDEGHAEWLVDARSLDADMAWSTISRGVRLAHGVRKQFVVAAGPATRFVALTWMRP